MMKSNTPRMVLFATMLLVGMVAMPHAESSASDVPSLATKLDQARAAFDNDAITSVEMQLLALPASEQESWLGQSSLAAAQLYRADMLRNQRKIRDLDRSIYKDYRDQQRQYGQNGMTYAEKALSLAQSDVEKAQAERMIGELYAHQITGPISGIRFGSDALGHIQNALSLAPELVSARRAEGLMFLYNPPMNGGDVEKAVEVFEGCVQDEPENDALIMLLAQAYRKDEQNKKAIETAKKALEINPQNRDAQYLLEAMKKEN